MRYRKGQPVKVLDTANDRKRDGVVQEVAGIKVWVYLERFKTTMEFVNGQTNLGRFKLVSD